MIPRSADWKNALSTAVRDPGELLALLELPGDRLAETLAACSEFSLRVPRGFVRRMREGDPADPLLRQVLPSAEELVAAPGFATDPVGEEAALRAPGLLHKYRGRALLVTTGACAIHCRYCFRRHFPYGEENPAREEWGEALEVLATDPSIHEVILSGGDPLLLNDRRLELLIRRLEALPHLRRLRIHTRVPVVLPERLNDSLLACLGATRLRKVVVIHANHPREIDETVGIALGRLREAGATLLNQAVLLRGVNDSAQILAELSESLFGRGVLPYYLHLLDRVSGAAHFEVPEEEAIRLLRDLRATLPGYLVPRLVREIAGRPFKVPVEIPPAED